MDIKSLTHAELEAFCKEAGLPRFRVKQLEEWLWVKCVHTFDEMTNLPAALRANLAETFVLCPLVLMDKQVSRDGTRKYLFELADGCLVESVGIPSADGKRLTVCFSTQVGCGMGCVFCATGRAGFTRNLHAGEIFDQVAFVANDFGCRVTNCVGMGQGEPFANFDAVACALGRLNSPIGLGIGARHLSVSTCGLTAGIERFAQLPEQYTLAVSLHSAVQRTRDWLMPGVRSQRLDDLRVALKDYGEATHRRPTLEYALIDGVNDDEEHIEALIQFCRGMLCHVNLIPLNPITNEADPTQLPPSPRMREVESTLSRAGVEVSIRESRGPDIAAACGQLANKH